MYEQKKKEKERKKLQKVVETKIIQLSYNIDVGDLNRKMEKAREELTAGNKVQVTLRLRGRENAYSRAALEVAWNFCNALDDVGVVAKAPNLDSRTIGAMLEPKK
jgi:translation initiation factor IF-3